MIFIRESKLGIIRPMSQSSANQIRKVFIKTHGCQMNEYDSSRIVDLLREQGDAELVDSPENADLLVLNTCSIREKAQEKVFHQLGRWRAIKHSNPNVKIELEVCGKPRGQRNK